jgi:hypothetical protein
MGMSTHIEGVKPPDEKWKKMKAAYDACSAAGVEPPPEVEKFFGGEEPDPLGVVVRIEGTAAVLDYAPHDCAEGFEVHIDKLPKDVKVIRFWNSY